MAKWLRDYLSFGSRRAPPQPPARDYTESELLRAYRLQKSLDFEDPYGEPRDAEDADNRTRNGSVPRSALCSPLTHKHRLIKVDSVELSRGNVLLSTVGETREPVIPSAPLASDTDYSDPFDARPEACGRPDAVQLPAESCSSYMEPYEAQRVLTELQKGASCSRHTKGGVQLYDTPYEERTRVWRTRSGTSDAGRESKLPRDDERPADEYDQPWEWKKDNISKAFAVQFAGADRERHIPSLDRHQSLMSNTSQTAGTQKYRKHADAQTPLGERVDPTLALEKQVWYHGALSRSEAESLLTLCKECSYLVRKSQSCHSDYSLSIRSCQGFMHMKFTLSKDGKFILGQNSPPFGTIPEVIHYYTTHKLPIRGAEHMSLLYPVLVQTL